jgi:hypothetical protein
VSSPADRRIVVAEPSVVTHIVALERMTAQVAEWEAQRDGRAVFLDCYARMTAAMNDEIAHGLFEDPVWVATLLDRFAIFYFDSIDGGEGGARIPEPWLIAHAAAVGFDASPLQLLLAGVNAHINYDLVLTLVDLLAPVWHELDADQREMRRRDYDHVNDVIVATVDLVQDEVVERYACWCAALDIVMGRLDEALAARLLIGWRRRVWRQAAAILDQADRSLDADRFAAIERQCLRRSQLILL